MTTIFSALPYATAKLHLGRILTTQFAADVYQRYLRFTGKHVAHITGLDCHGSAVYNEAVKNKISPATYCNLKKSQFLKELNFLKIKPALFLLTHSTQHRHLVCNWYLKNQTSFQHLNTQSHFCVSCNRF